jgi:DNA polymerase-1
VRRLYLIDGHAQIFRAYYAPFPPLNSPSGEPTKATFIFTQMVLSILREKKPDYIAVALDYGDESTERRQLYSEYKANREATPEDLPLQVERIKEVLAAMEIPIFEVRGQEADDLIATIGSRLDGEDVEVLVASRDKDLHQLISRKLKLWDPAKDVVLDAETLVRDFGFTPEQAVEVQTLTGDSTDNVPGVPGVGPKKAAALVQKYGSVSGVLEHLSELTPKMRESIEASRGVLDLSRRLVTLRRDVPLDFDLERCRVRPLDPARLRPLFERLGFRRLIDQLDARADTAAAGAPAAPSTAPVDAAAGRYRLVNDEAALRRFLDELRRQPVFALDTETTSLRAADCDLVGLSFSWAPGEGYYLPVRTRRGQALDPSRTLEALRPVLEDPKVGKCGQNIKFDMVALGAAGVRLRGVVFDSMVASYLLNPDRRSHGLDALAQDFLGYRTIPISDLIGKGPEQGSMLDVDLDRIAVYAAEDADVAWRLREALLPQIEASGARQLFHEVEMPLVEVLAAMELEGVTLEPGRLEAFSEKLELRIEELRREIYHAAGHEFAIDSPKQLGEVLFDEHGLRVVKRTKTSRSTDASVLETLAAETAHPLPALVIEYRELAKLLGTYVEPLPALISPRTGRIHTSYHQTVAATGRLSSSDPNLQNIPIRTPLGREIRRAFVPSRPDRVLLTADYSQIELRILAHLSQDSALIEAFHADQDIHAFVASEVAGVPLDKVSKEARRRAKAVNFGIIYGQGAFGLARSLGIPQKEAAEFIRRYKARHAGIARFMAECIASAEKHGEVRTMLGRRRPIPGIGSRNRAVRAQAERLAVNTVVQGSAADMIKAAMVRVHRRVEAEGLDLRLLIQVHDELVFETPAAKVREHAELVRHEMASALPLSVPLKVDAAWGENWLEGKGME